MTVDIARVKSDRAYRDTVRRKNAQAFFVVGTVCLLVLIAFVINADVSHVAGWFAIVGIVLIACSFLTQENPISTAIGFVRLYRNGLRTFLPRQATSRFRAEYTATETTMTPAEAKDALPRCGMRIYIGRSSEANLTERMAGAVALGLTNRWVDTNGIDDTEIGVSVKRCFYMDPDIIGISRLSSAQAAKAAVMAMECGHLVLTTLDVETEEDAKAKLRNWGLGENLWSTPGFIHFCLR